MPRIDAAVATQVAEMRRPQQSQADTGDQIARTQVAAKAQAERGEAPQPVDHQRVVAAAAQVKQVLETASGQQLDFHVDDNTHTLTVQIRDQKSGKLLRQVPGEEVLKMQARIHDLVGMVFDKHV